MIGDYAITLPEVMKVGQGLKDGDETAYSYGYDAWLCDGAVCKELIRDDSSSHRCIKKNTA